MTTRFTARPRRHRGVSPLPSGYDPSATTDGVSVAACGIEDVDRALFNLFETEIPFATRGDLNDIKRPPVIFAAQERWAMIKKTNGIHDRNGSLILPLITIVRGDVVQTLATDVAGRGANQHVGELTVKRRLSPADRGYQNLINKRRQRGQKNVALNPDELLVSGQPSTDRVIGGLEGDPTTIDGSWLTSDRRDNVFEVFTVPTPQKVTVKYQITLWSQHQQQSNSMIEACLASYLPQTRGWRIETKHGYWFNAFVTSDEFASRGNATDVAGEERIIKHEFSVEVPCFILASSAPGLPLSVKRYVSAPVVEFSIGEGSVADSLGADVVDEPFLGSDDPTLPLSTTRTRRSDGRQTGHDRLGPPSESISESDPALAALRRGRRPGRWRTNILTDSHGRSVKKYVRILSTGPGGETVVAGGPLLGGVDVTVVDE